MEPRRSARPCAVWVAVLCLLAACGTPDSPPGDEGRPSSAAGTPIFSEIQDEVGLVFRHRHGGTGRKYMIETMGSGGGFLDFDGDGWQDAYLVQSGSLPGSADRSDSANRLFRNTGDGNFVDVTEGSGAGETGYGMGCSFGDYDNDGFVDIYVTNFGPNSLLRNNGDGTFSDVTERAGVGDSLWGVGSAFADYDLDGDLDLYVVNYVLYTIAGNKRCGSADLLAYCHPDVYDGAPAVLYRNEGDGTFTDVTRAAGPSNEHPDESKGLGVAWSDFDDDGDPDIYVSNDSTPNFLFSNNGDGTFTDIGLESGVAYNADGKTEAGMGIATADYDRDGDADVIVTHLEGETNTLYQNLGGGIFEDRTTAADVGLPSLQWVGFGVLFVDYDNDGWLDLFIANGHILEAIEKIRPMSGSSYGQANQIYRNDRDGGFTDVSATAGSHFEKRRVSRGAAYADIDNDGDADLLITNNNQEAVLLRNEVGQERAWIGFRLIGTRSNRDAIGARVELTVSGEPRWLEVLSGGSYLSQSDLRLRFGLGDAERPEAVKVHWPNGGTLSIDPTSLAVGAYNEIVEPAD